MIFFQHKNKDFFLSHIRDEFPNPDDFKMHIHSQAELLYVLSGGGSFHIEGNVYATERESISQDQLNRTTLNWIPPCRMNGS